MTVTSTDSSDTTAVRTDSRPASVWPPTTAPGEARASSAFGASRFDDSTAADPARQRQRVAELYDLCRPTLVLRVVLFVQAGVAVAGLVASPSALTWLTHLAVLAFPALAATLLWLATVCALKPLWPRLGAGQRSLVAIGLGALMAVAGWALLLPLGIASSGAWPMFGAALAGLGLSALVWAWLDLRAQAARPADASARLAELQSRIRPHFLFNALNTAVALVQIDPERAERVLEDLSQLFRVALAEVGASVTLAEEIDLARRYLEIEQVRFGERLAVTWEVDPATADARVPPLVLQPLVENAVRHGIEASMRGGYVRVKASVRHGIARVVVSNSLPDVPTMPGAGIALANVRERLSLLHDIGASLETWRGDGQFHARVTVPL
jgi:two-component system, LytTR family, sensor histidine kinase AlgZ